MAETCDGQGAGPARGAVSSEALRAVIEATDEGLLLLDAAELPVLVNRRFREFFDLPETLDLGEIRAAVADCMAHPEHWLDAIQQEDDRADSVFELRRPIRRIVRRRVDWVTDADGRRRGRLIAYRDITSEVAANRLKDEFVGQVSHELRTPMAAIKGFLGVVLDDEDDLPPDQRRHFLEIVREQTERLSRLIEDLLDIARIESGRQQRRDVELPLRRLLTEVVTTQREQAEQAGLHLELDPPAEGLTILADRDQLLQIVLNLVSNALKFTPAGGRVRLTCQVDGEGCRIAVQDTGCGIAAADLPHIFEKFYRARPAGLPQPGTGLGLSIAADLARGHDGRISVESTAGEGSVFTVWLPPGRVLRRG